MLNAYSKQTIIRRSEVQVIMTGTAKELSEFIKNLLDVADLTLEQKDSAALSTATEVSEDMKSIGDKVPGATVRW